MEVGCDKSVLVVAVVAASCDILVPGVENGLIVLGMAVVSTAEEWRKSEFLDQNKKLMEW